MDWGDRQGPKGNAKPSNRPTRPSIVRPWTRTVHAEGVNHARRPAFPQGAHLPSRRPTRRRAQSCGISCAHTAIIPTKSAIDASAAASSTNILNITRLPILEHNKNIVQFLFQRVKGR
jgi:hypothetical protein